MPTSAKYNKASEAAAAGASFNWVPIIKTGSNSTRKHRIFVYFLKQN